jgi:anthranilate phosphoribosyltransferase
MNYEEIFTQIIDAKISAQESKKILLEMNKGKFSCEIFLAAMNVLKARMKKINAPIGAIDVCGTGGDKLNTLNISTAVCFVVAACGVVVAKHGNRAISSKSGSADIFSELGIEMQEDTAQIEKTLREKKLCFLYAPFFHESLKNLAQIRKEIALEYGVPTIFNYLGPLLNPANTKIQMIGVSRHDIMLPMAQALQKSGSKKVYLVHGFDGMDEITICDNSYLLRLENGIIHQEEVIDPQNYGFQKVAIEEIKGGDVKYNAQKLRDLFCAKNSAYKEIVILNSAFALKLAGKVDDVKDGVLMSRSVIDSGGVNF